MVYIDRYKGLMTANLPIHSDLGRFAVMENGHVRDLTNIDAAQLGECVIRESIFDVTNENIHSLLHTIAMRYDISVSNVKPIIQNFDVKLNEFEEELLKQKYHLKYIIRRPHYLLNKNVTKVNIGRAKRITTRSYQYLASHSEDWERLSVVSPKPRKILHEELEIDYAVYENMLLKAFLHHAIRKLNSRIKDSGNLKKFFMQIFGARLICPKCKYVYEYSENDKSAPKNCPNCNDVDVKWIEEDRTIWSERINRRNALIGQSLKSDQMKAASEVNEKLTALKSELVKMEHSALFDELPKKIADSIVLHETNVLNSHQHYKYLKILWNKLFNSKLERESLDIGVEYQTIMNDMRTYVETLFVYVLSKMGYAITGRQGEITAVNNVFPCIDINSDDYGVLHISTETTHIRVITLGGKYELTEAPDLSQNTVCFCYGEYQEMPNDMADVYFVNPIDTSSIEKAGKVIRKLIIEDFLKIIVKKRSFMQSLKNYICDIKLPDILFDLEKFTYSFGDVLPEKLDIRKILSSLRTLDNFRNKNKRDQEEITKNMSILVRDINDNISFIKERHVCPKCAKPYRTKNIKFMTCECGFICDTTNNRAQFYHRHKDDDYSLISTNGWGMDYID